MNVNFTRISDKPFLADIKGVTTLGGMAFKVDEKTGLTIPRGLNREVANQVGEGRDKTQLALENTPLEQLRQSTHPRAQALITWIESNEDHKKWYLENVGTNFDLVQDGIMILGNIWELEDEKMNSDFEKGISNENGFTFFTLDAQDELFGDSIPENCDWNNLIKFIPGNNIKFLIKVLGLNFNGMYCSLSRYYTEGGIHYWARKDTKSKYAYSFNYTNGYMSFCTYHGSKLSVRRFNVKK